MALHSCTTIDMMEKDVEGEYMDVMLYAMLDQCVERAYSVILCNGMFKGYRVSPCPVTLVKREDCITIHWSLPAVTTIRKTLTDTATKRGNTKSTNK